MKDRKLVIVRGLPGSGKSTFAKRLGILHFEADMWFDTHGGFDKNKLKDARTWCYERVSQELHNGNHVVVSNTFTQAWEMQKYLQLAEDLGIEVKILTMDGNYKSIHGVPEETVRLMRDRFDTSIKDNTTKEELLKIFQVDCTFCGSNNFILHEDVGCDVGEGFYERQHMQVCSNCGAWRFRNNLILNEVEGHVVASRWFSKGEKLYN